MQSSLKSKYLAFIFSHLTKIPPPPPPPHTQNHEKDRFLIYVGCTQKNRLNESSPTVIIMKVGYLNLTNMYTGVVREYHVRVEGIFLFHLKLFKVGRLGFALFIEV